MVDECAWDNTHGSTCQKNDGRSFCHLDSPQWPICVITFTHTSNMSHPLALHTWHGIRLASNMSIIVVNVDM